MTDSLPKALHESVLNRIVDKYGLTEDLTDGGPYLPLESHLPMHEGSVGHVRRFTGEPLFHVVTSSIVVPAIQLDSHMVFAFMPSDSPIPHFTVDSVCAGDHHAFHLDLIPRVDIGSRLKYLQEVYQPLDDACDRGRNLEGLERAHLSPTQWAIMSPWMLANRASVEAFTAIGDIVTEYLEHWFALVENGISDDAVEGISREQLIERDARNKQVIFNPAVDPVWERIIPMVGAEAAQAQIELLQRTSQ